MKKRYVLIIVFFVPISIIISAYIGGPPAGTTNAPGETTCYSSPACHGGTPNTGPGFGEMTIMGGVPVGNFYIPDSTYVMMPYVVDATKLKGGFQVVARFDSGNNAGTASITLPVNTQITNSGGYDYVEQTAIGAVEPILINMHDWMYNWQAPPAGSGTVTFYVAFIAGDGDSTVSGDNIYIDTLVLYEDTTLGIRNIYNTQDFLIKRIYPLPTKDFVSIDFETDKYLELFISVIDINGKLVVQETPLLINPSVNSYKLNLKRLSAGIYFVKVKQGSKSTLYRKIVKY